jgi:hypothetical protein
MGAEGRGHALAEPVANGFVGAIKAQTAGRALKLHALFVKQEFPANLDRRETIVGNDVCRRIGFRPVIG